MLWRHATLCADAQAKHDSTCHSIDTLHAQQGSCSPCPTLCCHRRIQQKQLQGMLHEPQGRQGKAVRDTVEPGLVQDLVEGQVNLAAALRWGLDCPLSWLLCFWQLQRIVEQWDLLTLYANTDHMGCLNAFDCGMASQSCCYAQASLQAAQRTSDMSRQLGLPLGLYAPITTTRNLHFCPPLFPRHRPDWHCNSCCG